MGYRTVYISTITIPVYASWRCEKCGEINVATGTIKCKREEGTSALRPSKHKEAQEKANKKACEEWKDQACKIISDPKHTRLAMHSDLVFENTKCTLCGKTPRCYKGEKNITMIGVALIFAILSGLVALNAMTSVAAWLVFAGAVGLAVGGFIKEEMHMRTVKRLPKGYSPVIGSLNPELINYANERGMNIPTPDDCVRVVKEETESPIKMTQQKESCFCHKCGTKLFTDSAFCHKCGIAINK